MFITEILIGGAPLELKALYAQKYSEGRSPLANFRQTADTSTEKLSGFGSTTAMDYYEELGLDGGASREEIRQAYKRLVRLFHPDRCRDDALRLLADLQMKRLNGILRILTDPVQRADYDLGLLERRHPFEPASARAQRPPPWFCFSAISVVVLGAVFLAWAPPPGLPPTAFQKQPEPQPVESLSPASAPSQPAPRDRKQTRATRTIPEEPPADSWPAALAPADPAPEPITQPAMNIGGVALKPAGGSPAEVPTIESRKRENSPAASPPPARWSGEWFYVAEPRTTGAGLYPPEYIELRITEDAAGLHGRYRARYRVPDRAISPAVIFHFDGTPTAEGSLPWTGPGGARGEVKLHLSPGGALEVSWAADHLGDELGLISGSASLIRKLD